MPVGKQVCPAASLVEWLSTSHTDQAVHPMQDDAAPHHILGTTVSRARLPAPTGRCFKPPVCRRLPGQPCQALTGSWLQTDASALEAGWQPSAPPGRGSCWTSGRPPCAPSQGSACQVLCPEPPPTAARRMVVAAQALRRTGCLWCCVSWLLPAAALALPFHGAKMPGMVCGTEVPPAASNLSNTHLLKGKLSRPQALCSI